MITWTVRATRLGALLVAATPRGVCFSAFGDDAPRLEAALAAEFPYAELRRDDVGLEAWSDALVAGVDGGGSRADVPLDVSGSRFQRRVWDALRAIPRGQTRAYSEVAAALGAPQAARAVARACAHNPAPVAIPCHRVVPRQGGTGGYAFGAWRKRALLAAEAGAEAGDVRREVEKLPVELTPGRRVRVVPEVPGAHVRARDTGRPA